MPFFVWRLMAVSALLVSAAASAPKDAFKISGYIGKSSTEPASGVTVKLMDGESGKVLDSVRTGFTGRYKFENLKPGSYILEANGRKQEVMLKAKDVRPGIGLCAPDGIMS